MQQPYNSVTLASHPVFTSRISLPTVDNRGNLAQGSLRDEWWRREMQRDGALYSVARIMDVLYRRPVRVECGHVVLVLY